MLLSEDKRIRKQTVTALAKRHIFTENDLVETTPRHYRDYTAIRPIQECRLDSYSAVSGKLLNMEQRVAKTGRDFLVGKLRQEDGTEFRVIFFSRVFLIRVFQRLVGSDVVVCVKVTFKEPFGYSIGDPDMLIEKAKFVPKIGKVYTHVGGVSDEMLRSLIHDRIGQEELLETEVIRKDRLPGYRDALMRAHYPTDANDIRIGHYRLLYNDMLYFAMSVLSGESGKKDSSVFFPKVEKVRAFMESLPFRLTADQETAVHTMLDTANQGKRNQVLLQGDVGTGKTVVAACMMIAAAENGYQSVLMAPRTVLAQQHYQEISRYAENMGYRCVFLSSGMKAKEAKETLETIRSGEAQFIIGTHSTLAERVEYANLGLIVTDEEHLFGVEQKEALSKKAEEGVHSIAMSATPIPRSLAGVLFGANRTILTIRTKPAGRKDIQTSVTANHEWVVMFMEKEIRAGHQCYVVCPAITDDDNGLENVENIFKMYRKFFEPKGISVGTVNGKMKPTDVEDVIGRFRKNECQVLISTTVIEVGVNVPNATVMVVEQADRFGLASLHQLRGRVGRSSLQSYCFLISEDTQNERLQTMAQTNDGFKIAEADLRLRGSGNLIGLEQAGKNRYVSEIIAHPDLYKHISETAKFCIDHGYGKRLLKKYAEHEEADKK